jgi:hypothetical protein
LVGISSKLRTYQTLLRRINFGVTIDPT